MPLEMIRENYIIKNEVCLLEEDKLRKILKNFVLVQVLLFFLPICVDVFPTPTTYKLAMKGNFGCMHSSYFYLS